MTIMEERAGARTGRQRVLVAAVALAVAAGGWLGYRQLADRPPFEPAEVRASAVLTFTDWSRFSADAETTGAEDLGVRPGGAEEDRIFVARVDHHTPEVDDSLSYQVAVIDDYHDRAASVGNVGGGRPLHLDAVADQFPPLGRDDEATCCWLKQAPASGPGSITFAGTVRDGAQMTENDLTVVLMLVAADGTVHWAEPISA